MRIRIEGTLRELDAATEQLHQIFHIVSVSKPYKNRNSELHRVYVEIESDAEFILRGVAALNAGKGVEHELIEEV